eukprot:scaffold68795_cov59-Cyclotella_meneghiniana.AAC.1
MSNCAAATVDAYRCDIVIHAEVYDGDYRFRRLSAFRMNFSQKLEIALPKGQEDLYAKKIEL